MPAIGAAASLFEASTAAKAPEKDEDAGPIILQAGAANLSLAAALFVQIGG